MLLTIILEGTRALLDLSACSPEVVFFLFLASPQQGLEDLLFLLQPLEDRSISEFKDGYILYVYICQSLCIPVL